METPRNYLPTPHGHDNRDETGSMMNLMLEETKTMLSTW
jgi:hypothetical protein